MCRRSGGQTGDASDRGKSNAPSDKAYPNCVIPDLRLGRFRNSLTFPPKTAPPTYKQYIAENPLGFKETQLRAGRGLAPPGAVAIPIPDSETESKSLKYQALSGFALKCLANLSATAFH
jgi:hypothetical protein